MWGLSVSAYQRHILAHDGGFHLGRNHSDFANTRIPANQKVPTPQLATPFAEGRKRRGSCAASTADVNPPASEFPHRSHREGIPSFGQLGRDVFAVEDVRQMPQRGILTR